MKKVIALILTLAMILMVGAVYADGEDNLGAPYLGDTHYDTTFKGQNDGSISIGGLVPEDQVKFYKVLAFDQDANGVLGQSTAVSGWKVISPFNTGDNAVNAADLAAILTTGITSELAGKIAQNATGTPYKTATVAEGSTVATASDVDPGLYVAIVVPANAGLMFNPVFVASDYYKTGDASNSSTWTPVTNPLSYSDGAMAKKAEIEVTKTATEGNDESSNETHDAKAVAVGDAIYFTVKTTIPEFASNYTEPVFVVSDKLSAGLTFGGNNTITVSADTLAANDHLNADDYTISNPDGLAFKITFKPESLLALSQATPITITYSAIVKDLDIITNVNEEDNTVTVTYSHEPSVIDEGNGKKVGDKTHHYTFTIDGYIWGNQGYKNTEIVKVGLDKNGNEITEERELSSGNKVGALKDAKFRLYTDSECNNEYKKGNYPNGFEFSSDDDGRILISGLDAGEYWLKETTAPDGYMRYQDPVHIKIVPSYWGPVTWTENGISITSDDILKSYYVEIDEKKTAEYVINYEMTTGENPVPKNDVATNGLNGYMATEKGDIVIGNTGKITISEPQESDHYGKIENTQGVELPSTGGIGTTIFYILGGLLVVGAAVILVARRKAQD